ncbi:MAG: hypothetical protein R3E98_20330 [Gemmatimonadota bacterium]
MSGVSDERLHDYLDGELDEAAARALDVELERDVDARERLEALADLRNALGALPLEARAPAGLWSGIAERIGAEAAAAERPRVVPLHAHRQGPPRLASRSVLWAAGLAGLLAVGAYQIGVRRGATPTVETAPVVATAPAPGDAAPVRAAGDVRAVYDDAVRQLEAALEAGTDVLQPETRATLERSLATIDRAIVEAEAALAADPGSPIVERRLLSALQFKLDLLQQAVVAVQRAA